MSLTRSLAMTGLALLLACSQADRATADARATLLVSPSPMQLRATGGSFDGRPASPPRPASLDQPVETFAFASVTVARPDFARPLSCTNHQTGQRVTYPMFDLAIENGWYNPPKPPTRRADLIGSAEPPGTGGFRGRRSVAGPQGVRGVHRVGDVLWIGTNGVGVITFDVPRGEWSRYDVKPTPVPGHHMGALAADDDFVFVSYGGHPDVPHCKPGLHVFSPRTDRWLRVDGIPTTDVLSLGWEDSVLASRHVDDRPYATEQHIPPRWQRIERTDDGSWLLTREYSNGTNTRTLLRRELLVKAFEY